MIQGLDDYIVVDERYPPHRRRSVRAYPEYVDAVRERKAKGNLTDQNNSTF
jgi:hypothetical protein